jgi:2-polyprenyl-6-methoxyphenol hydroxylase-like FAD-dependent oxidoreductase
MPSATRVDSVVIGAGIAGASIGHWLAPHARIVVLEREDQPGYHSTGRSAALFMESYGTPQVRALTMASRAFLEHPPAGFSERPILTPRGALMVAAARQDELLDAHWRVLRSVSDRGRLLGRAEALALVPVLRAQRLLGAVYEPGAMDIDVHALHQGYLRAIRRHGGAIVCNAEVDALDRTGADTWHVSARGRRYEAKQWRSWRARRRSGLSPSAARRSCSRRRPMSRARRGRSLPGSTSRGTSSPMPACCSARRRTPIRSRRRTCSPRSSISPSPSTASRR